VRVRATLTLPPILRPFGPLLRWRIRHDSTAVLEELAYRLENEAAHPRKLVAARADGPRVR
jgi:hypothetical protein